MEPDRSAIEDKAHNISERAGSKATALSEMNMIADFAPEPLLRIDICRDCCISALGDATATAGVAIGQMRAVLDDVEGTAIGAEYTLSKRIGQGYTPFSGAWSEKMTEKGRGDGARRMVSVLRRNCYLPLAGLLAPKWRFLQLPSLHLPRLDAEWIFGDSSSFTVAGPHRDCTGLPFSALAGTLGLTHLYHATGYSVADTVTDRSVGSQFAGYKIRARRYSSGRLHKDSGVPARAEKGSPV